MQLPPYDKNKIWFLIARSLNGEAAPEDIAQLEKLLKNNSRLQQQYELLQRIWKRNTTPEQDSSIETDNILKMIHENESQNFISKKESASGRNKKIYFYAAAIAAIFIIVAIFSAIQWQPNNDAKTMAEKPLASNEIMAVKGSKTRTILPDGSKVWLNAGSKISYLNDFTGSTREIALEGEAYFDIEKNPSKPFIVHVSGYTIKVLGTAFSVKSYPEDKTVETLLFRGLVQLSKEGDKVHNPIFIHPNEKIVINKMPAAAKEEIAPIQSGISSSASNFSIIYFDTAVAENEQIETAWMFNRLEFRDEDFETLAPKLERWYNVSIVFQDEAVKHLSFNGSFENESIEQAFQALKTAVPFKYSISNQTIFVKSADK